MHHQLHRLIRTIVIVVVASALVQSIAVGPAAAGNPFYPQGDLYALVGGVKFHGWPIVPEVAGDPAGTPNSYATAFAWRTGTDNQLMESDGPGPHTIFQPDSFPTPAYTQWDVGSSAWTSSPVIGDQPMIAFVTKAGLNGWTGPSWVAGAKTTIDVYMISHVQANYRDSVMEPIPTPAMQASAASPPSITVGWRGLWDNSLGAAGGTGPASVVGYSLYRSVNGGAFALLTNAIVQNAGANIAYVDSTVVQGSTYAYELGVRFEWTAHTPKFYEPTALGPSSGALVPGVPKPVLLKYLSSSPSTAAGANSAVITVETADAAGNPLNVAVDTTVNLSSSSTGANKKFLAVSGGVCTSTVITTVAIPTGSQTAQFCYYDEKAGTWSLTSADAATVAPLSSAALAATVTSAATLASLTLSLASPQVDRLAFTGTNTLTAKDTYGNTITSFSAAANNVTLAASPVGASVGGLAGVGSAQLVGADFALGVANLTTKLKLSGTIGSYTITATAATAATAQVGVLNSSTVTLGVAALDHFDFVLSTPQTVATAFTGTNTLTARDIDNNVLTAFNAATTPVTVTESSASGTVSGLGSTATNVINQAGAFVNGVASLSTAMKYSGTNATAHTFTATVGAVVSPSNSVTFAAGPVSNFLVSLNSPQVNGMPFTAASITARDVANNTVTTFDASTDNVTIAAAGAVSLTPALLSSGGDFVNGVATLGSLRYTGPAGSHVFTVSSITTAKSGTATVVITAGAAVATKIVNGPTSAAIEVPASALSADATLSLWSAAYDVSGNWTGLVPGSWTSLGTLAPSVVATGVTTISFDPTTAPASGTITVTVGALTDATGLITVTHGAVSRFGVSAPAAAVAGVPFTLPLVQALDSDGNVVLTYTGSQVLVFGGAGIAPNGTAPSFPATVTFASGVATAVPVTLFKAETATISVTQAGHIGVSVAIAVSAAAAGKFVVTAAATQVAGVPFDVALTAQDQWGNVATSYTGDHTIVFTGPGTSPGPVITAPAYPGSVTFNNGAGIANVTLFNREKIVVLTATQGSVTGSSAAIGVGAAAAWSMAMSAAAVATQPGAVLQAAPTAPEVEVRDQYGNLKDGFSVSFFVVAGDGQVSNSTVITGDTGRARVSWTLGPSAGTDNNVLEARATNQSERPVGDPVVFMASASADHFEIVVPPGVTAGAPFPLAIRMLDVNNAIILSYDGLKTVTFSGPHAGPDGTLPSYPLTVTFLDGVPVTPPQITLYLVETQTLSLTDGTVIGTSAPIAVGWGPPAQLAFMSIPQTIHVDVPSDVIDLCIEDQYGNSVFTVTDTKVNVDSTSRGGQFTSSAMVNGQAQPVDAEWNLDFVTVTSGRSCVQLFYRDLDGFPGLSKLEAWSQGLTSDVQDVELEATTPTSTTTTTVPSTTTTTVPPVSTTTTSSTPPTPVSTTTTSTTEPAVVTTTVVPVSTTTTSTSMPTSSTSTTSPRSGSTTSSTTPTPTTPASTGTAGTGGSGGSGGTGGTGGPGGAGGTGAPGGTAGANTTTITVTVYVDRPTVPVGEPVPGATVDIPLPISDFPAITSPRNGALITPIAGTVYLIGTAPARRSVTIISASGAVLGATTSDSQGNWRMVVASSRFTGSNQDVQARLQNGTTSTPVSFSFKQLTFLERLVEFFDAHDPAAGFSLGSGSRTWI